EIEELYFKNILHDCLNNFIQYSEKTINNSDKSNFEIDYYKRGRGSLLLKFELYNISIQLVLPQEFLLPLLDENEKHEEELTPLDTLNLIQYCADKVVTLHADLAVLELSMHEVFDLSEGDIIVFNKPVTERVNLKTISKLVVCAAEIGTNEGRRVLK